MKKLIVGLTCLALVLIPAMPARAARVVVGVGYGFGCCAYPYPAYPAYAYAPPYYVAPPPTVVYAPPVAPPVMAPVTYAPVTAAAPAPAPTFVVNPTSPTFIDNEGRTCRHFESTGSGPAYGTACLMSDGSWRTVQ